MSKVHKCIEEMFEETFAKECGTCSVSHWFLCHITIIQYVVPGKKKGCISCFFDRRNVEHRSDFEFFCVNV